MKNIFLKSCYGILFLFLYNASSFALEVETHRALNEHIATKLITPSSFSLGTYLKSQLGFQGGVDEKFNSLEAWKWLRDGGEYEDVPAWYLPYLRSVNHFHNPITKRGYSGIWGTGILSGESSLLWAQKPKETQWPGGYYSWHDVRDYFYQALTSSDKNTRDTYFAQTFRGLGQLMHLVQDLSVPAHTRNDGHGPCWLSYNYECWVEAHPAIVSASTPNFFDLSVLGQLNPLASVPIANLFDTNKYNGTNPEITISKNIGLSEYTNANFTSDDTIFSNFPYPKYSSQSYEMYDVDYSSAKKRIYLRKKGDGEQIEHFATAGPFYKYLSFDPVLQKNELKLDPAVYKDYASLLIPRAVGYSAGLLNYFFRGKIDMIPDDATGSGYVIVNNSDEDISGTFELWYDDTNDNRKMLWSGYLSIVPNGKSSNITFTKPSDAKWSCKYVLVLNKGTMGQEQGAVVGKVVYTIENCSSLSIVNEDGTPATDTIFRNGTLDFKTTDGCCGDIVWSVSDEAGSSLGGSIITQTGVLTAGSASCGSLKVTATCSACGTSASQDVRVTNNGTWRLISLVRHCDYGTMAAAWCIEGRTMTQDATASSHWMYDPTPCPVVCEAYSSCPKKYDYNPLPDGSCRGYFFTYWERRLAQTVIYEWQCP